jgi:hypothetical protein
VYFQANGLRLDCDAAFPLDVHLVEELVDFLPFCKRTGPLQQAICERALTVVDVSND